MASTTGQNGEDLQDFFNEAKDIQESGTGEAVEYEPVTKTPDEGELEKKWLHDAGYGHLVPRIEEAGDTGELNPEIITEEISSLTKTQAAAVIRRVNTLHQTFKRKRRDVRSVFPSDEEETATVQKETFLSPNTEIRQPSSGKTIDNLLPKRGVYDMSGSGTGADGDDYPTGIETLSIQTNRFDSRVKEPGPHVDSIDHKLDAGLYPNSKLTFSDVKNQVTDPIDGLLNFVLVRDKFGITRITDLSQSDLQRIRSLALIELTALFDNYGIQYSSRKVKKKYKDTGQFGVPLQMIVDNERKQGQNVRVPTAFKKIVEYLNEHCLKEQGILRVPGSAVRIKVLRKEIDENLAKFRWEDLNHNDVAALLKQYLRDLPVPVLTHEYIEAFAQVELIPDKKQQLQALNLLVIMLPDVHRDSLKMLLAYLWRVVEHNDVNKMNISNVSMIIAPNLFLVSQAATKKPVKEIEINMAAGTSNITKTMIKYQDILWTIPSFLVTQIRHQYESELMRKSKDNKSLIKLLKKEKVEGYKKPPIQNEADFQAGLVRVTAPMLTKSSTAIQLEEATTAADVVAKFKQQKSSETSSNGTKKGNIPDGCKNPSLIFYADEATRLFETGGNIGERCMDPAANMLESYRVNPNAEWVIKDFDRTLVV